ncbi:MAG: hypothetical protein HWN79_02845 [Candidatus Lokiarchaeota archaeon]|nr:hypothetical protein [Candidatus Lokiarchaeota archaeon]
MTEFLLDFFVLADGGKVIFSHCSLLQCDETLIGAYFHAINSIYKICFERDMQKVSLNQYRLHFKKIEPFFFIGISTIHVKTKVANENFEILSNQFYKKFRSKLTKNWESDVALFHNFNSEVDKQVKEISLTK